MKYKFYAITTQLTVDIAYSKLLLFMLLAKELIFSVIANKKSKLTTKQKELADDPPPTKQ